MANILDFPVFDAANHIDTLTMWRRIWQLHLKLMTLLSTSMPSARLLASQALLRYCAIPKHSNSTVARVLAALVRKLGVWSSAMKRRLLLALWLCAIAVGPVGAWQPPKWTAAMDAFFVKNSTSLRDAADLSQINYIAFQTKRHKGFEVLIAVGHASADETDPEGLAVRRAEFVKALLIAHGVDSKRVYTDAKAAAQPVGNGVEKDRRVEIEGTGPLFDSASSSWSDVRALPFHWRDLQDRVRSPPHQSNQHRLPLPWSHHTRDRLPILEFVQTITDPHWRHVFANRLLVEAIWRRDDQLAEVANTERIVSKVKLESRGGDVWGDFPDPVLEAAGYGTDRAWAMLSGELLEQGRSHDRIGFIRRMICSRPPYGIYSLEQTQQAARRLFQEPKFFALFSASERLETQNCASDETLAWMLGTGGNPDLTNVLGRGALHLATRNGDLARVKVLLDGGANIHAIDANGETALHQVSEAKYMQISIGFPSIPVPARRRRELWDLLVKAGVDPQLRNKAGMLAKEP